MVERLAALVSDEIALEACIRDDALYKLTIFTFFNLFTALSMSITSAITPMIIANTYASLYGHVHFQPDKCIGRAKPIKVYIHSSTYSNTQVNLAGACTQTSFVGFLFIPQAN